MHVGVGALNFKIISPLQCTSGLTNTKLSSSTKKIWLNIRTLNIFLL